MWAGLVDHLFNNAIASNLLHVLSLGQGNDLQIIRILFAQLLSYGIVLYFYRKAKPKHS